ncbi:DgyrCDS1538 [Dimorphilus gyrociliatus]|uniref:DgyrCDS1538 n=1 Tax=Dimorphilus gyrociliatus TaxID=2664684 RepID=A0A7I8VCQ6_9ANNE|nr:DgyrCDS1538 [Dimorphilus gyrociliatus]
MDRDGKGHPVRQIQISSLNESIMCALCGGYLINATSITECHHSFCRSCIMRFVETSRICPICDVKLHETRPWESLRLDLTLQKIVFQLVPGLATREFLQRRRFQRIQKSCGRDEEADEEEIPQMSICLECKENNQTLYDYKRYLKCPVTMTIEQLKKFIRRKFTLNDKIDIDIFHAFEEPLVDANTILDCAVIFGWTGVEPFHLNFTVDEIEKDTAQPLPLSLPVTPKNARKTASKRKASPEASRRKKSEEGEKKSNCHSDAQPTSKTPSQSVSPPIDEMDEEMENSSKDLKKSKTDYTIRAIMSDEIRPQRRAAKRLSAAEKSKEPSGSKVNKLAETLRLREEKSLAEATSNLEEEIKKALPNSARESSLTASIASSNKKSNHPKKIVGLLNYHRQKQKEEKLTSHLSIPTVSCRPPAKQNSLIIKIKLPSKDGDKHDYRCKHKRKDLTVIRSADSTAASSPVRSPARSPKYATSPPSALVSTDPTQVYSFDAHNNS